MKRLLAVFLLVPVFLYGQTHTLTLQQAYDLARQNFPLVRQHELIRLTSGLSIENLGKGFLPQISFHGQATYQSDVTDIKSPIPNITFTTLSKDQYQVLADVNQLIYDGGMIRQQKNIEQLSEETEQQKLEVELYKLKERINQLFLGVLYLDEQLKQVELVKKSINSGIRRVDASVKNGTAFRSELNVLKAELLQTDQHGIELASSRKALIDILGLFVNQALPGDQVLERPVVEGFMFNTAVERPELKLYSAQEKLLGGQYQMISSRNRPRASLFWQGGYGRPGLNFLENRFDFYYTTGIRLNWSLSGLYTRRRERKIIELNQRSLDVQKDVFLFNTDTQLKQQQAEIEKLRKLVDTDAAIIDLREQVKDAAQAQLDNGVITANDFLREVNAEDQARQNLITHQVQLLQAQINYQTISGKQ